MTGRLEKELASEDKMKVKLKTSTTNFNGILY